MINALDWMQPFIPLLLISTKLCIRYRLRIDHIVVGYVSSDIPLSLSLSLVYLKETMPDIMLWKQAIKYLTLAT